LAVALGEVDGQPVIVTASDDKTVWVWDAHSGQHCCIEADAEVQGVVCVPESVVVAATKLGLAAFKLTAAADPALSVSRNEVRLEG
jgi:WD40 repeat protein